MPNKKNRERRAPRSVYITIRDLEFVTPFGAAASATGVIRRLSEMLLSCLRSLRQLSEVLLFCLQSLRRLSETLLSRLERFHQLVEGSRPVHNGVGSAVYSDVILGTDGHGWTRNNIFLR